MAPTPSGNGYWLVASDGGIFAFGDAGFFGSTGAIRAQPADRRHGADPVGQRLLAGGVGRRDLRLRRRRVLRLDRRDPAEQADRGDGADADRATATGWWRRTVGSSPSATPRFFGSTGAIKLNRPIVGHGRRRRPATATGSMASDGGIFSFGDAAFFGAAPSRAGVAAPARWWPWSRRRRAAATGRRAQLRGAPGLRRRPRPRRRVRPHPPDRRHGAVPVGTGAVTGAGTGANPSHAGHADPDRARADQPDHRTAGADHDDDEPRPDVDHDHDDAAPAPARDAQDVLVHRLASAGGRRPIRTKTGYAQLVDAVAEVGRHGFVAGEFTDLVDHNGTDGHGGPPSSSQLDPPRALRSRLRVQRHRQSRRPGPGPRRSPDRHRLYVGRRVHPRRRQVAPPPGRPRPRHGPVDPSFNPPDPNAYINALALSGGRALPRRRLHDLHLRHDHGHRPQLAAMDAATGPSPRASPRPRTTGRSSTTHTGEADGGPRPASTTPAWSGPGHHRGRADAPGRRQLPPLRDGPGRRPRTTSGRARSPSTRPPERSPPGSRSTSGRCSASPSGPATARPSSPPPAARAGSSGLPARREEHRPDVDGPRRRRRHRRGRHRHPGLPRRPLRPRGAQRQATPASSSAPSRPTATWGSAAPTGTPTATWPPSTPRPATVDPTFTAQADTNEGPERRLHRRPPPLRGRQLPQGRDTPGAPYRPQPGLAIYPTAS